MVRTRVQGSRQARPPRNALMQRAYQRTWDPTRAARPKARCVAFRRSFGAARPVSQLLPSRRPFETPARGSPGVDARKRMRMLVPGEGRTAAVGPPDRIDHVERVEQRHDSCCDMGEVHVVLPNRIVGYDRLRRIAAAAYQMSSAIATARPKSLSSMHWKLGLDASRRRQAFLV